jgi:hypothetical protein
MKRYIIILLILFCSCSTTNTQSSTDNEKLVNVDEQSLNKIKTFWEYASKNESKLLSGNNSEAVTYFDELFKLLKLINENLGFYIFEEKNNRIDLIISSGGNSVYFELCDTIVQMSPKLVKLNPISLMPPLEKIEPFTIGNMVFSVDDVRVHFDNDDNDIDLMFILNEYHLSMIQNDNTEQFYSVYLQVLNIMTLQLLGERVAGNRIKNGFIAPLSTIIPSIPFIEMKKYIK